MTLRILALFALLLALGLVGKLDYEHAVEDCLVIWWETRMGEAKFRNSHCPSPLKTP